MSRELTPKQKIFVKEYLVDINCTHAALRAGYSPKMAGRIGYQLLEKTRVKEAIQVEMDKRAKRTEITADKVLQELAKIGFADIKDYLAYDMVKTEVGTGDDGSPIIGYKQIIDVKPSSEVDGAVINEVSVARDGTFKFKLCDKQKALELIGKHLAMFTERQEISGKDGGPVEVSFVSGADEDE